MRVRNGGWAGPQVYESFTPLAAASVWAAVVLAGWVSPLLAPVGGVASRIGLVVVLTLVLHLVHEAGHVVAGLLVRLPFRALTVGLFTLRCEPCEDAASTHFAAAGLPGRWRYRWALNRSWRRFAGCVEREVTPAPEMREALTVTALGGPLASILLGALLAGWPAPWGGLGNISLVIGLLNLVPTAMFGQVSDGMIVWRLWSSRPQDVAWRAPLCGSADA